LAWLAGSCLVAGATVYRDADFQQLKFPLFGRHHGYNYSAIPIGENGCERDRGKAENEAMVH
jgi:hypothetical protein